MSNRKGGILLHITSLPGDEGIGTFGKEAYRFVDFLLETKQKLWQILPLGQVGYGDSPYQCYSAFAGNIQLIDLELLVEENLLQPNDIHAPKFNKDQVEFSMVGEWKMPLLRNAFETFQTYYETFKNDYKYFLKEHDWWLKDFALFMAAKKHFNGILWNKWPDELKFRYNESLKHFQRELKTEIEFWKFLQWQFFRQWFRLKDYANSKGIEIIGDVPLYVSTDSADVWTNTDIFQLDENLNPTRVGGVPPDYFSETGQLWGNPVYNWQRLEERQFDWWLARLHFNLNMFDIVRIDHFRGLESYWSVPAGEKTAINGEWVAAKGYQLLAKFNEQFGRMPFIAEDLGVITPEVEKLRDDLNLTGIKVIQFAFGTDETNANLPHNYYPNFLVCTGTHDNDTTLGWFCSIKGAEKKIARKYLGRSKKKAVKKAIDLAWRSTAKLAIIPMQDLLELGTKARMNTPGTASGNWGWRFDWKKLKTRQMQFLKETTIKYNRFQDKNLN